MKQETIDRIRKFVSDRAWEANELLECFQWSDTEYDLEHVKEELADVLVYCRKESRSSLFTRTGPRQAVS